MGKSALDKLADFDRKRDELILEARGEMESSHRELTRQLRDLGKQYSNLTGESLQRVISGHVPDLKPVAGWTPTQAVRRGTKLKISDRIIKHMIDKGMTQISVPEAAKFIQSNKLSEARDYGSCASAMFQQDKRFARVERGVYYIKNRPEVAAKMAGAEALNGGTRERGAAETEHGPLTLGS